MSDMGSNDNFDILNPVKYGVGEWWNSLLRSGGKAVADMFDPAATGRPSNYYGMTTSPMKDPTRTGNVNPNLPVSKAIIDSAPTTLNPQPQAPDTYLNLLYSLLEQSKNTGGYGSALSSIQNERKGINTRYKENQGDIKNMFGNLTTMRRGDIAGVSQLAETGRAASAQQTGNIAQQTRDAETQRLAAANQARAALGLGEIAGAAAGGDIATQASEAGLADQAALAQIGQTASQTNQSITEQAINDEIARYSTEQGQSLESLGRSRDTALSDVAGREQQILMQQASAQQAAQQANTQLQLQIASLVSEYEAGKLQANTPTGVLGKWLSEYGGNDPSAGVAASTASASFWNWIQSADNLMGKDGKPMDAINAVSAFAKYDPETAKLIQGDPSLNFLLTGIWNSALTKPKTQ